MRWDPQKYEQFDDARTRPFHELVARLRTPAPRTIVDVGCGNGLATLTLPDRFPGAHVVGVDSSPEMLSRAREHDAAGRVEWVEQSAEELSPAAHGADVVVSNALLQWVPTHRDLLLRWLAELPTGGELAFQVPGNFDAPSHALMREAAAASPHADVLLPRLRHEQPVDSPEAYAHLLSEAGADVDAWETTYVQWLDPQGEVESPVLEWVRGTGLRPLLGVLEPAEEERLVADYAARLQRAYPRTRGGVAFPFRRIFCVARKGWPHPATP